MIINLLIISIIVCYVIDISGFVEEVKKLIWKLLYKNKPYNGFSLKPVDCSRCMCFWTGLIYIIIVNFNLYNLLFVCCLSLLAEQISNLIQILQMFIQKVEDKLFDYIYK